PTSTLFPYTTLFRSPGCPRSRLPPTPRRRTSSTSSSSHAATARRCSAPPTPSSRPTSCATRLPAPGAVVARRPAADLPRLGVLGWPVAHSRSPQMQNAALEALGLSSWRYQLLPVPPELLAETVRALPAAGFRGVN